MKLNRKRKKYERKIDNFKKMEKSSSEVLLRGKKARESEATTQFRAGRQSKNMCMKQKGNKLKRGRKKI
jgi:hypothetical protein